jgi:glycosyltransferase involved in cell wall biosynthesis
LSAHVVVGNSYLADYSRRISRRVTIIPSSIDTTLYQPAAKNGGNGRAVVGWTGTSTSQTYLEMFAPVWRELVARWDFEFRIISDREPQLSGVPHVWRRWSALTETKDLRDLDVGIMPMPDDSWSRGKCALKALQYMAMGIPAVCSDVGMNREVIRHGENGFLAGTPEEWLKYVGILIDDPVVCERLGREARKTVEERYSMRGCAALFADAVRQTVRAKRPCRLSANESVTF